MFTWGYFGSLKTGNHVSKTQEGGPVRISKHLTENDMLVLGVLQHYTLVNSHAILHFFAVLEWHAGRHHTAW